MATAKGYALGHKGAATRQRMLDVGRELLDDISPFELTPVAICRSAQLTSALFYAYFANIGEFLYELVETVTVEIETADLSYLEAPVCSRSALQRLVDEVHGSYMEHHALLQYRNVLSERGDDALMKLRTRASLPRIERLAALIAKGSGAGKALPRADRLAEAVFINAGIESLAATAQHRFDKGNVVSWPRLRDAQVRLILKAIG